MTLICFPNHQFKDSTKKYLEAKPNEPVINRINKLYENGNKIIFLQHEGC